MPLACESYLTSANRKIRLNILQVINDQLKEIKEIISKLLVVTELFIRRKIVVFKCEIKSGF